MRSLHIGFTREWRDRPITYRYAHVIKSGSGNMLEVVLSDESSPVMFESRDCCMTKRLGISVLVDNSMTLTPFLK